MPDSNAPLSGRFIEQQRQRLEILLQQILGPEASRLAQQRSFQRQHGNEAQEFEENAQGMAQNEVYQALHDINDRRVHDIERALEKIHEGSYGRSDRSGEPIPKERLEATPEAIFTVEEENLRERSG